MNIRFACTPGDFSFLQTLRTLRELHARREPYGKQFVCFNIEKPRDAALKENLERAVAAMNSHPEWFDEKVPRTARFIVDCFYEERAFGLLKTLPLWDILGKATILRKNDPRRLP